MYGCSMADVDINKYAVKVKEKFQDEPFTLESVNATPEKRLAGRARHVT